MPRTMPDGTVTPVLAHACVPWRMNPGVCVQPKDDQPEIHLRPNKLVEYKYVAEVMAEAQHNNAVKIGLLGNEQFADQ